MNLFVGSHESFCRQSWGSSLGKAFIFTLALLLTSCSSDSHPISSALPEPMNAEEVSMETTEVLAFVARLRHSKLSPLQAQATTYSATIPVFDIYNQPFVNITIHSPTQLNQLDGDAKLIEDLDFTGAEHWSTVITGATHLHTPVSMVESGTTLLQDFQATLQAMGGANNLKRIVALRSTSFLFEGTNGQFWDTYLKRSITDDEFRQLKQEYDAALKSIAENRQRLQDIQDEAWDAVQSDEALATVRRLPDGGLLAKPNSEVLLTSQARLEQGVFNFRPGSHVIIKENGNAQTPTFFERPSSYRWRLQICDDQPWNRVVEQAHIGCGPASFAALLAHQFQFHDVRFNQGRLRYNTTSQATRDATYEAFLKHLTHQMGDQRKPLIAFYMETCSFNGSGLTRADMYVNGMKRFVADQTTQLGIRERWARTINIPGSVEERLNHLRFAKQRNIPAVIEYPAGSLQIHYSIVREWNRYYDGTYAMATNSPGRLINLGDTLNGETGIFLVYKK